MTEMNASDHHTNRLVSMIRLIILLLSAFPALSTYSATLNFRHYSVKEGLANSTVYDIFQDSRNFIWIATESGVNRFDGNRFELFTMDNGLSDNEVLQIREDSSGKIWFLTLNGKPSYFFKEKFYNTSTDPLLRKFMGNGSLTSFFEDSSNRLWFSTNQNKLIQIGADRKVNIYSSPEQSFVNATVMETMKKEIIVFSGQSVFKLEDEGFSRLILQDKPLSPRAIHFDKHGKKIHFLGSSGLVELNNSRTIRTISLPKNLSAPANSIVYNINELWIGTMGRGLLHYNPHDKTAEYHLKGISISHVLADKQGNIWVATIGNGVYLLPYYANSAKHLTRADGLSADAVTAIARSGESLILGNGNGGLDILRNKGIENIRASGKNRPASVKKIYNNTATGSLWYASDNALLERFRGGGEINLLNDPKWSSYALKSFSLDNKDGKIAVALASGVYVLKADRSGVSRRSHRALSDALHFPNRAFAVHYDQNGGLWFSNIEGLHYYNNGALIKPYKKYSKLRHRITDITTLPDSTTVCSSYGFGVFVLKDAKLLRTITTKDGLESNICKKLFAEGNNIWVVTGRGVSRINIRGDEPKIKNYNTESGLLSNEINDIYVDKDTAYIASNSGLTIFREKHQSDEAPIPSVLIRSVSVNNQPADIGRVQHLSHTENNVSITFISMDYAHPEQVLYSYRTSRKEPWIETKEQTIEFSSLNPDQYKLEVRAKSMSSEWTRPTSVEINIKGPFWLRWWFIGLAACLSTLLLFLVVRHYYRVKQLKEKEKLLSKARIISLEQQALQAMMNPHFIFNVMNSIQYFINTRDNTMANQVLTGFARLIRKNLEICNKSYINVEEEITYLNLYLSLEKMRFGDSMSYSIVTNTDVDLTTTYIPSMLLQPYVENAIWHGIMPMNEPGEILVEINNTNDELILTIRDNGVGIDESLKSKSSEHISRGMQLTRQRIDLLNKFNKDHISISVSQHHNRGTLVTVKVLLKPFTHLS